VEGEIREVVRRATEAFNRGDIDAFAELHTGDAEIVPAAGFVYSGPLKGKEALMRFYRDLFESLEDTVVAEKEIVELDGGRALFAFEWRATGPASGIETSSEWIAAFDFRDGRFTRVRYYGDRTEAAAAVGLAAWPGTGGVPSQPPGAER
jgi:ketosteroid isomerase-like protein